MQIAGLLKEFPGLKIKIQDFPRFPGDVRTVSSRWDK
jgi:hypothetical protein